MIIPLNAATDERIAALLAAGYRVTGGTVGDRLVIIAKKGGAA